MSQTGTDKRFRYKKAVVEKYPQAKCRRTKYLARTNTNLDYLNPIIGSVYFVYDGEEKISGGFYSAESAWEDAYSRLTDAGTINP